MSSSSASKTAATEEKRNAADKRNIVRINLEVAPWDRFLVFHNSEMESRYLADANREWMAMDANMFKITLVIGIVRMLAWRSGGIFQTIVHHVVVLLMCYVVHPFLLSQIIRRPASYLANRTRWLPVHRTIIAIGVAIITYMEDTLSIWGSGKIFFRFWTKSSLCALFCSSMGFRLPFRRHLFVQGLAALASGFWVIKFCHACELDGGVAASVNYIGWVTEGVMERFLTLGFPVKRPPLVPGQYPCWLVGLFYHCWVGFFAPSVMVYISECLSRSNFLKEVLAERDIQKLKVVTQSRLMLMGLITIVGSQSLWFSIQGLAKLRANC